MLTTIYFTNTTWDASVFPFIKLGESDGYAFGPFVPLSGFPNPFGQIDKVSDNFVPSKFAFIKSYPNPFNPITAISFALPEASHVQLSIFNIQGRQVDQLINGRRDAGYQDVTWDATNLPSGIYFYRIHAGEFTAVRKMVLVK